MSRGKSGERKILVLNAIPFDDFVRAGKISKETGLSPQAVGCIISKSLIPVYVEMKEISDPKPGTKTYKRRPTFHETRRPRD